MAFGAEEKTPAPAAAVGSSGDGEDVERSLNSGKQDDLVMYTGQVDANEYGTLKREYVPPLPLSPNSYRSPRHMYCVLCVVLCDGWICAICDVTAEAIESNFLLKKRLKSRHVQFIAIGGMIGIARSPPSSRARRSCRRGRASERVVADWLIEGTGLFLGTGLALQRAGPLSIFLAYSIVGVFSHSNALLPAESGGADLCRHRGLCDGSELGRDCHLAAHKWWLDRLRLPGMSSIPVRSAGRKKLAS